MSKKTQTVLCLYHIFTVCISFFRCPAVLLLFFLLFRFQICAQTFKFLHQAFQICYRKSVRSLNLLFYLLHLGGSAVILRYYNIPSLCLTDRSYLPHDTQFLFPPDRQFFCQLLVEFCLKQLTKNHFLLIRSGTKQFHKFSLGNHGNLHKLTLCQPYDLFQLLISLLLWIFAAIRQYQTYLRTDLYHTGSPLLRPYMSWTSAYCIHTCSICILFFKNQFHIWFQIRFCILALKLCPVLFIIFRTGFSKQCKYNGIKNGRFPCTCISADQKQILLQP